VSGKPIPDGNKRGWFDWWKNRVEGFAKETRRGLNLARFKDSFAELAARAAAAK